MVTAGCFACANSIVISLPANSSISSPHLPIHKFQISQSLGEQKPFSVSYHNPNIQSFRLNAANNYYPNTKPNSIVCNECDGNGAILCKYCKGNGVNAVDHFNGRFKAGDICWLCRGKREILCGNCNGAGFIGGFMSTFDE